MGDEIITQVVTADVHDVRRICGIFPTCAKKEV